jgi:hypothetical protein
MASLRAARRKAIAPHCTLLLHAQGQVPGTADVWIVATTARLPGHYLVALPCNPQ